MTRSADSSPALVVLIEPTAHQHHASTLLRVGFRVISVPADAATVSRVLGPKPSVVAAELNPIRPTATFAFARGFRADPQTRLIPFVVYGDHLRTDDIDAATRAGTLWLQLEPSDGARPVAAVRGLPGSS